MPGEALELQAPVFSDEARPVLQGNRLQSRTLLCLVTVVAWF